MRLEKIATDTKLQPSFKAVKAAAFYPDNAHPGCHNLYVNFTQEDKAIASKIFGMVPNPDKYEFSVQMFIEPNAKDRKNNGMFIKVIDFEFDYGDKALRNQLKGYIEGMPQGSRRFAQLCQLMQKATARPQEYLKDPQSAVKFIKEFFTIKK